MKRIAAGLALALAATGSSVVIAATPASADPAALLVSGCVRKSLTTGYQKPNTTVNKASSSQSSCHDLNLVYAADPTVSGWDQYAGFYKTSDGAWHIGTRGYKRVNNGPTDIVLLSGVAAGTTMGVGSFSDGGDYVEVLH